MHSYKKNLLLGLLLLTFFSSFTQNSDSSIDYPKTDYYSATNNGVHSRLDSLYQLNSYEDAVTLAKQYVDSAATIDDSTHLANMLLLLGIMQQNNGDNNRAFKSILAAYTIFRSENNQIGIALSMDHLGSIFRYHGSKQKSLEYHMKAYDIFTKEDHIFGLIRALNNLGIINRQLGNHELPLDYHIYYIVFFLAMSFIQISLSTSIMTNIPNP